MNVPAPAKVLVCDHPWPDLAIEREVLEAAGHTVIDAQSGGRPLAELAHEAAAIMTCFAYVTADVVAAPDDLRIVTRLGTGVDMIDTDAVRARGAVVSNVPEYCTDEVAEHTLALMLAATRGVVAYDRAVRSGAWGLSAAPEPRLINGKTLGIVGFGKIGAAVARRAAGLGMNVVVHSRRGTPGGLEQSGARAVGLDELASCSDVVTLHVPLEPGTRGLVGRDFLARMKPHAVLVNTGRGALVDEQALAQALAEDRIAAAAVDVLTAEPPPPDHPLLASDRLIVTPHIAFWSPEAVAHMRRIASKDVARALAGEPVLHVVT